LSSNQPSISFLDEEEDGEADPTAIDEDATTTNSFPRNYAESLVTVLNSTKELTPEQEATKEQLTRQFSEGHFWHRPPHPLFVAAKAKKDELNPESFYQPAVSLNFRMVQIEFANSRVCKRSSSGIHSSYYPLKCKKI
jgi:hypothetical protein